MIYIFIFLTNECLLTLHWGTLQCQAERETLNLMMKCIRGISSIFLTWLKIFRYIMRRRMLMTLTAG